MNFKKENEDIATIDLHELTKVLWLHKWMIAIAMCITFALGFIAVILKEPIYPTTALIQVKTQGGSQSQLSNILSTAGGGGMTAGQASQSQIEMTLMESPYILEPTIHKLNLDVSITPKYFPILGSYIANHYGETGVAPAKLGLSSFAWGGESWSLDYFIVPQFDVNQKFKLLVGTNQTYQLFNAEGNLVLTGQVGQAAASSDGMIQMRWNALDARPGEVFYLTKDSFTATLSALQKSFQLSELGPLSNGGTPAAGGMMLDTGILQLSFNSPAPEEAVTILNTIVHLSLRDNLQQKELSSSKMLKFIQQQLVIAKAVMIAAQNRLNQYEAKTGIIDLGSQANWLLGQMTAINNQLAAAQVTQAQYQQMYTNANPIMQNFNVQVLSLEQQKARLQKEISALPFKDQLPIDLSQDEQIKAKLYMELLTDEQQSVLARAGILSDMRVLDFAQAADEPLPQHRLLILFASLLIGFILGSLFVLIRHQLKNVVSDPYWIEREFGIRTVSIIPFSPAQAKAKKAYDEKETRDLPILAVTEVDEPCVESMRSLRTSLFFALKEKQTKLVNITGVVPQTGKSFISVNLATILAQTGKRVILIDGDMRRGYLNRYFKKSHAPGLSDILSGILSLDQVITPTQIANLDFIATGIYPDNPSELLLSISFKEILETLAKHYDVVLLDSPPILAVNDASIIAKEVPINYLVVPGGQLKSQEIEAAVRRFHNDGITLTGSLFNFAKPGAEKLSGHHYQKDYASQYKKDTRQQQA